MIDIASIIGSLSAGLGLPAAGQNAQGNGQPDLAGLFGQLFAGAGNAAPTVPLVGSKVAADVPAEDFLAGLEAQGVALPEGLTGLNAVEIKEFVLTVVEVRHTVTQFASAQIDISNLNGTQSLAAAFESLGYSPEEAMAKAEKLEAMLDFMNKRLGIKMVAEATRDDKSLTMADILGHFMTQVAPAVSTLVTTISQLSVREIAFSQVSQFTPTHDMAACVLCDKPLTHFANQAPLQVSLADVNAFNAKVGDLLPAVEGDVPVAPIVKGMSSLAAAQDTEVLLAKPLRVEPTAIEAQALKTERVAAAGLSADMVKEVKPNDIKHNPKTYTPVAANEGLAAPKGVEVYKWDVTKTGLDVMTQVAKPEVLLDEMVAEDMSVDEALTQLERGATQGKLDETARSDTRIPFADRLMQAARAQVTQQVSVQMKALAQNGGGNVRIQLNPEELGRIDIDLEIHNGRVHGTISAERPEVIEQMARELQLLKQSLADAGFSLGENGMSFMLTKDGSNQNDNSTAQNSRQGGASENAEVASGAHHAPQRWVAPDRLLDLNV